MKLCARGSPILLEGMKENNHYRRTFPPGLQTRCISLSARTGFSVEQRPKVSTTVSNELSGYGSCSAFARDTSYLVVGVEEEEEEDGCSAPSLYRAMATMPSLLSTIVTDDTLPG